MKWSGKRIVKLDLYKEVSTVVIGKLGYEHLFFLVLHCICLYFCFQTIGEQHAEALARAEERNIDILDEAEKLRTSAMNFLSGKDAAEAAEQDFAIPSQWLPGFWPSISFGLSVILHALMVLGQQWSIGFRCFIRYRPVDNVTHATHARILPGAHLGKEELVPIQRSESAMFFEFHRRKYVFDAALLSFIKVRCRVNHPIEHYVTWTGIPNESICHQLKELYGPNKFQMASPTFMDLYFTQITSPFTVFQLFCVLLWCMDSYWQYSLFTLFMICSFEATTVFSRLKSLQTLRGMGNEAHNIYVYRCNQWNSISTEELLPGDVFSLTKHSNDIIPCDALIIRGAAVVNEATLTGESVPQMKDGIANSSYDDMSEHVNIKGVHKTHALFGGTRVLQVTSVRSKQEECEEDIRDEIDMRLHDETAAAAAEPAIPSHADDENNIPPPPDDGCLCYCTRTGFSSSQGKLVRMIENSTAAVRGDTKDTVYLLLILLVFALSASGYVLYMGMQDGSKSKYQLLLHCILIVTSVIPPELPMQTALAVNSSLMTLMKMQVFCTEPFRVPIAGKVDTCIFDKTGTLTTDELVAVGVVSPGVRVHELRREHEKAMKQIEEQVRVASQKPSIPAGPGKGKSTAAPEAPPTISAATAGMTPIRDANVECTLVLGGCHSLVLVDGKVAGDPLEVASVKAIRWELSPTVAGASRPKPETLVDHPMKISTPDAGDIAVSQMTIMSRHHFSSKLQRMSVVSRMKGDTGAFVLVKGSPEAIGRMCTDCPTDYADVAGDLAKRGMRVIALAMKRVTGADIQAACDSRSVAESHLHFAGFAAFTCRVRKDTPSVVQQLRDGGMTVCMATGDAMLTAVHVAIEVGITTRGKKGVLILERQDDNSFVWIDYDSGSASSEIFSPSTLGTIEKSYDLCVAGPVLSALMDAHPEVCAQLDKFVVFARMRPDEKERVLLSMRNHGRVCLMCGDGANDVGALKQAHVGVALLSGFGDLNVARESGAPSANKAKASTEQVSAMITQADYDELLKLKISDLKARLRQIGVEPDDYPHCVEKKDLVDLYRKHSSKKAQENHDLKRQKELMKMSPEERKKALAKERQEMMQKKQDEFKREYDEMVARGESWAMFKAMQKIWAADMEETKKKRSKMAADNSLAGSAGRMAAMMDQMEGMEDLELPMVKIGDASVASPFTSKMPSIRGAVDIIRQGRCTLVTTIQMYQILALNCLISAYSLSVLHLDGVKYGDRQMTCLGMLMSVSFVTISRSKPLDKLSPVRPLKSVFHPALILSLFGQFALHLATMYFLVQHGKTFLPEGYRVDTDKEFSPNIVNSVVFLVTAVQQVSVFVVNLKGPPFMGGLVENTPLLWSLAVTFVGTFMCASESIPQLNVWLQLQPFPTVAFRNIVLLALTIDVCGSFLWDRLLLGIFAYPVLSASLQSTTRKDVISMVKTFAIVIALVSWIASQDYTELIEEMERVEAANSNSESLASSM